MSDAPIISTFAVGVSRQELDFSRNATSNSAAPDHGSESHWATNLFIALHAVALALLLAVVLPAFLSPQVHRMKTWFSFIVGWMCFCISYLVIAGHQWGAEPAYSLCLFQAAFVYASPVLTASASFCYVLEVFLTLRSQVAVSQRQSTWFMYCSFILSTAIFTESLILGATDPTSVSLSSNHMYCHISTSTQAYITYSIVFANLVAVLTMEVWVVVILRRNWVSSKYLRRSRQHAGAGPAISKTTLYRIGSFSIIPMIVCGLQISGLLVDPDKGSDSWDLSLTALPLTAALIFGTQRDIIEFWASKIHFRRRQRDSSWTKGHAMLPK